MGRFYKKIKLLVKFFGVWSERTMMMMMMIIYFFVTKEKFSSISGDIWMSIVPLSVRCFITAVGYSFSDRIQSKTFVLFLIFIFKVLQQS